MNKILSASLLLILVGCGGDVDDPVRYVKEGDDLIECVSKLDQSKILYHSSKATKYIPENMPVEIYYIVDVHGKKHSLNNYEIENYSCNVIKIKQTEVANQIL